MNNKQYTYTENDIKFMRLTTKICIMDIFGKLTVVISIGNKNNLIK